MGVGCELPTCRVAEDGVVVTELEGLLTAYRLATALLADAGSPIEAERQEQQATRTAREIADLLASTRVPLPV